MTPLPKHSPWGQIDEHHVIAPGIVSVSTPSHGGYWLSPERRREMQFVRPLADFQPWGGQIGWYEEDCDWCIFALAFPEHFPDYAVRNALRTLEVSGAYFDTLRARLNAEAGGYMTELRLRVARWTEEHRSWWEEGGYGTHNGGWRMDFVRVGDGLRVVRYLTPEQFLARAFPPVHPELLGSPI